MSALDPLRDPQEAAGFRLLGRLGRGGFGSVYLGRRRGADGGKRDLDTLAAVKILREEYALDAQHMRRFRHESEALRRCAGTRIPELLDFDFRGGVRPAIATRFIPGPSLYRIVDAQGGGLGDAAVRCIAADLVDAVHTAHRKGLLHRDLQPGNVLLTQDGPWVIDFGLTQIRGQRLTMTFDSVMCSPHFCAPEQLLGLSRTSPATDVFGIGAVLLYAVTGHPPYPAGSGGAALMALRAAGTPADLTGLPGDELGELIRHCVAEDPQDRPTMEELARSLDASGPLTLSDAATRAIRAYRRDVQEFLRDRGGGEIGLTVPFRPGRRTWSAHVGEWVHAVAATGPGAGLPGAGDGAARVVAADGSGRVHWLDAATGAPYGATAGFTPPVRLHARGRTVLVCDAAGQVQCWDAAAATPWWPAPLAVPAPARALLRGQSVFVSDGQGRVTHLDAFTGRLWWRADRLAAPGPGPVQLAAVDEAHVYVLAGGGRTVLALDDEDGAPCWAEPVRLPAPVLCAPLCVEDGLVVADIAGTVRCLGAADGHTRWEQAVHAPVVAAPVEASGAVVIGDTAGAVTCLATKTGQELWCADGFAYEEFFGLAVRQGVVYAGGWTGHVQLLDAADGALLQGFDLGGQVLGLASGHPGGAVYAAVSGGSVHAIPPAGHGTA